MKRFLLSLLLLISLSGGLAVTSDLSINVTNCIFSGPASDPYDDCVIFIQPGDEFNVSFNVTSIGSQILNADEGSMDSVTVFLDNLFEGHSSYYGFNLTHVFEWDYDYYGEGDYKLGENLTEYDYINVSDSFIITVKSDNDISVMGFGTSGGTTNLTGYYNYFDEDTLNDGTFVAFNPINDPSSELIYLTVYVDNASPITDVYLYNENITSIGSVDYVYSVLDDGIKFEINATDLPFGLNNNPLLFWNQTNPFSSKISSGSGPSYYSVITVSDGIVEGSPVYYYSKAEDKAGHVTNSSVKNVTPIDYPQVSLSVNTSLPDDPLAVTARVSDLSASSGLSNVWSCSVNETSIPPISISTQVVNSTTRDFIAYLGAFGENDTIQCNVSSTDTFGRTGFGSGSFAVQQDDPLITNVSESTNLAYEVVNITAEITDLSSLTAVLSYSVNGGLVQYKAMTNPYSNIWNASIGPFNENDNITYTINATDKWGYWSIYSDSFRVLNYFNLTLFFKDKILLTPLNKVNLTVNSSVFYPDINDSITFSFLENTNHTFFSQKLGYTDNTTILNITNDMNYVVFMSDNQPPIIDQIMNVTLRGNTYLLTATANITEASQLSYAVLNYSFNQGSLDQTANYSCVLNNDVYSCTYYLGNFSDNQTVYYKTFAVDVYGNNKTTEVSRTYINFIPTLICPPCPACPSCPSCPACPSCPECPGAGVIEIITEVIKIRELSIQSPYFFRAVLSGDVINIEVSNPGEVLINGLTINVLSNTQMDVSYSESIGDLPPGASLTVPVRISGFTQEYNVLRILVSDGVRDWRTSLIVYAPGLIPGFVEDDCLEFYPSTFVITQEDSFINISFKNKCSYELNDVAVEIPALNYSEKIPLIKPYGSEDDEVLVQIPVSGLSRAGDYLVTAGYDQGSSKGVLKFQYHPKLNFTSLIIWLWILGSAVLLAFLMPIVLFYYLFYNKNKRKTSYSEEFILNKLIREYKDKLKDIEIGLIESGSDDDRVKLINSIKNLLSLALFKTPSKKVKEKAGSDDELLKAVEKTLMKDESGVLLKGISKRIAGGLSDEELIGEAEKLLRMGKRLELDKGLSDYKDFKSKEKSELSGKGIGRFSRYLKEKKKKFERLLKK